MAEGQPSTRDVEHIAGHGLMLKVRVLARPSPDRGRAIRYRHDHVDLQPAPDQVNTRRIPVEYVSPSHFDGTLKQPEEDEQITRADPFVAQVTPSRAFLPEYRPPTGRSRPISP